MKDSDTDGFFKRLINKAKENVPHTIAVTVGIVAALALAVWLFVYFRESSEVSRNVEELKKLKEQIENDPEHREPRLLTPTQIPTASPTSDAGPAAVTPDAAKTQVTPSAAPTFTPTPTPLPPEMTEGGKALFEINPDYRGWLSIDGTDIDYPVVVEKADDDTYYLKHLFDGSENKNGTLFIPVECETGVGTLSNGFAGGVCPTTNILIFGHNQKSGKMFGKLESYLSQDFFEEHKLITFETAYEQRTYEVISVFRSHVFMQGEEAFRYYFFYDAKTEREFDDWYENITRLSEVSGGREAKYGDTFLTLSTCSDTDETGKHNENGRLAVIAVRIR